MCPAAGCAVAPAGRCGHLPLRNRKGFVQRGTSGTPSRTGGLPHIPVWWARPIVQKKKALAGFLFCYFMLSMAFAAKLLSTSASKSTHCAFVSSPASVITVSSRSSAERAIMGAAFHASICR